MLAIYASTALILLASLLIGRAILVAARLAAGRRDAWPRREARLALGGGRVRGPGHGDAVPAPAARPGDDDRDPARPGADRRRRGGLAGSRSRAARLAGGGDAADRRRPRLDPLPRQRPRRGARRGHLHQRPRGAALLGRLAPARLRPRAERGPLRLPDRPAGGGRGRRGGDGLQPRQLLQRTPPRDPGPHGADRARRPGRDARAAPDRDRRDHRASLPRGLVPRPERLQGDRDGALRARLRARPADGRAHRERCGAATAVAGRDRRRPPARGGRRVHLQRPRSRLVRDRAPGLAGPRGDCRPQPDRLARGSRWRRRASGHARGRRRDRDRDRGARLRAGARVRLQGRRRAELVRAAELARLPRARRSGSGPRATSGSSGERSPGRCSRSPWA